MGIHHYTQNVFGVPISCHPAQHEFSSPLSPIKNAYRSDTIFSKVLGSFKKYTTNNNSENNVMDTVCPFDYYYIYRFNMKIRHSFTIGSHNAMHSYFINTVFMKNGKIAHTAYTLHNYTIHIPLKCGNQPISTYAFANLFLTL